MRKDIRNLLHRSAFGEELDNFALARSEFASLFWLNSGASEHGGDGSACDSR